MAKARVTINAERCKGCALCVRNCPKGIIEISRDVLNEKGYHPAQITDIDSCTACANCARTCPDVVIKIEKQEKEAV